MAAKPPVLRQPSRLLKLVGVLLALFVLIYAATAATGFFRNQHKTPDSQSTDAQAPLAGSG